MLPALIFGIFLTAHQGPPCAAAIALLAAEIGIGSSMGGTENGPAALFRDGLDSEIDVIGVNLRANVRAAAKASKNPAFPQLRPNDEIVSHLASIHRWIDDIRNQEVIPITLGGDHSIAIATASGARKSALKRSKKIALIWFDAHTDRYYDSHGRNFPHAIAMSQLLGQGDQRFLDVTGEGNFYHPRDVIYIGTRDKFAKSDAAQEDFRNDESLLLTPHDIKTRDLSASFAEIEERLKSYDEVHLSFDIDVVDEPGIEGFGFKLQNGVSAQDTMLLIEYLGRTGKLTSMDFVELMPHRDVKGKTTRLLRNIILSSLEGIQSARKSIPRPHHPLEPLPMEPSPTNAR